MMNNQRDSSAVAESRNLYPSFHGGADPLAAGGAGDAVEAKIDIQEPLQISPGERKTVPFSYRTGVPQSTAFSLTWHEDEADAELLINMLQDTLLPTFTINPPYPRRETGGMQRGEVVLVAPREMAYEVLWGALTIYQPGGGGITVVRP